MNQWDLKCFIAVAQTRSFTKAAQQLYMTQPSLSRKIANIERSTGCQLLIRTTRNVELTPAGMIFLKHAYDVVKAWDALDKDMSHIRRNIVGELKIGYNPIMGQPQYLIKALHKMRDEYPDICINLSRAYAPLLVENLLSGSIDCCFVAYQYVSQNPDIEYAKLHIIPMYVLLPQNHVLAKREHLFFAELSEQPLIIIDPALSPHLNNIILNECRKAGFEPNIIAVVSDVDEMTALVRAGIGIALLTSINTIQNRNELIPVEIYYNSDNPYRVMSWRKNNTNSCIPILKSAILEFTKHNF